MTAIVMMAGTDRNTMYVSLAPIVRTVENAANSALPVIQINRTPKNQPMKLPKLLPTLFILAVTCLCLGSCQRTLCANSCPFNHDGQCDDGGEGSDSDVCELGSDCADCGEREG